jgi:hypothetical protein
MGHTVTTGLSKVNVALVSASSPCVKQAILLMFWRSLSSPPSRSSPFALKMGTVRIYIIYRFIWCHHPEIRTTSAIKSV